MIPFGQNFEQNATFGKRERKKWRYFKTQYLKNT